MATLREIAAELAKDPERLARLEAAVEALGPRRQRRKGPLTVGEQHRRQERREARHAAEVRRLMASPAFLAKVEEAKASGELVQLDGGLWAMGPYTDSSDPVALFVHARLGLVIEPDGRLVYVEPWAREQAPRRR